MAFNAENFRKDFPTFSKGVIYMDSSCVSLKPVQVINALNSYYNDFPACGGRSNHSLGLEVTNRVKEARKAIAKFFNTKRPEEIIFTRNTTEGINLVANSFMLNKGDKVLISDKEHNSNLIPWLRLAKKKGIVLDRYEFGNVEDFKKHIKDSKLVSFVHTSNLDGTTQDAKELVRIAHESGAKVLIDGAQSAPHKRIDVRNLDVDFFVASGHKMLGPSGTGILYGKYSELEKLEQFMVGGETVKDSHYDSFEIEDIPMRFEAGLQDYSGIVGLHEAVKYLEKVGIENIQKHETALNKIITEGIKGLKGLRILGDAAPEKRGGIISFTIENVDPHDIALQLDSQAKIMIRSGYHCCHSWFNAHGVKGSARVSLYFYNTEEDARKFVEAIKRIHKILT